MAEEKYDLGERDGMEIPKGRFGIWFENFWYHYKWHSIIALFIIFVIVICSVQMCSKEEYDVHIVYAGGEHVMGDKSDGDIPLYSTILKSLNEAVYDFDGNGTVNTSFEALYMLTAEEIAEIEKEILDLKEKGEEHLSLNYVQLTENENLFRERIAYSDIYVFLLSDTVYKKYQTYEYDVPMFASIRELANPDSEIEFLDDSAAYLHSTPFGSLPGLSDLPENTVIVLRSVNALSSHFNKDETNELFENSKKVVENMLNYED